MATPRLLQLSMDLADLLNDHISAGDVNGEEFTKEQRLLALNRAEAGFISRAVIEQSPDQLAKNLHELLRTSQLATGFSPKGSPAGSVRTIKAYTNTTLQQDYMFYVEPSKWFSVTQGYNAEEVLGYGNITNFHWTEINRQILWTPNAVQIAVQVMYIQDHVELTYNGANDFLLPARYDTEILKIAYEFLTQILVKE